MLSAKGHTINKLRSDFDDLRRKYDDAIRENKLMKQLQRRQEASLAKFEDKDEELPQLLRSHAAEVDNLRERLRRTQDREKDKDRRLKDKNEELNRLNDELKKLRNLADNKHLLDRDKLQRKVDRLQDNFDEKERRVNVSLSDFRSSLLKLCPALNSLHMYCTCTCRQLSSEITFNSEY